MRSNMYHIHNLAREKFLQASERRRHDYDNRKNRVDYRKGDAVLVRDTTRKKSHSSKRQSPWKDPYLVVGLVADFVYEIQQSPRSSKQTVHHDRWKLFEGNFPNW